MKGLLTTTTDILNEKKPGLKKKNYRQYTMGTKVLHYEGRSNRIALIDYG